MNNFFTKFPLLLLISLAFTGCATTEFSNRGLYLDSQNNSVNKTSKVGLAFTSDEDNSMESEYFGFLNINIQNQTQDWKYIKGITIRFEDELKNENVKIVSGKELESWQEAVTLRNKIDEHNLNLILGGAYLLGAGMKIAGDGKQDTIGSALMLGALTSLSIKDLNNSLKEINSAMIFPKSHLMGGEIIIPPGMSTRRWIVLSSQNHAKIGYITSYLITYQLSNGETETVKTILKNRANALMDPQKFWSVWQGTYLKNMSKSVAAIQ